MEGVVSRWHIAYFRSSGAPEQSGSACVAQIFFFLSGEDKRRQQQAHFTALLQHWHTL